MGQSRTSSFCVQVCRRPFVLSSQRPSFQSGSKGAIIRRFWIVLSVCCSVLREKKKKKKDSIELVRVHVELKRKAARTREEELLAERLRSSSDGISELNFHAESNKFFVSGRGTIFTLDPSTADAREIPAGAAGARLHTVLSSDAKRMGFVRNRNVFLTNVETGQEVQVSNANGTTVMAGEGLFFVCICVCVCVCVCVCFFFFFFTHRIFQRTLSIRKSLASSERITFLPILKTRCIASCIWKWMNLKLQCLTFQT